jgi:hypothetical protein
MEVWPIARLEENDRLRGEPEDVCEVELLLPRDHVCRLIEAAREEGLTAAALARRLIGDFLRRGQPRA